MKARFIKKTKQGSNIYSFYFLPEHKVNFIAGQFIELTLPFKTNEVRGNKRWFSLSSSPTEESLAITTRIFPDRTEFKQTLATLKEGSKVDVSSPMGDFVLPKDTGPELVFIAIGIGITPFRSIVKQLHDKPQTRNISLIFANKNPDDFIFEELLSGADLNYIKHHGNLDLADLKKYIPELFSKVIYLSGPEKTVEKFYKEMLKSGMRPEKISVDYFHNYD